MGLPCRLVGLASQWPMGPLERGSFASERAGLLWPASVLLLLLVLAPPSGASQQQQQQQQANQRLAAGELGPSSSSNSSERPEASSPATGELLLHLVKSNFNSSGPPRAAPFKPRPGKVSRPLGRPVDNVDGLGEIAACKWSGERSNRDGEGEGEGGKTNRLTPLLSPPICPTDPTGRPNNKPNKRPSGQQREHMHYKTTYACEGNELSLSCEHAKLIHLVRANYGRFSLSICNELGHSNLSVQCASFRAFLIMEAR